MLLFFLKHFLEDFFETKSTDLIIYESSLELVSLIIPGGLSY